MNELALFAGAGGGILASKNLGWRTVCAVECDAYAAQVLAQRQNDGILEPFPIWSDVRSFDGRPWKGIVDVISGGFPCQDISNARTNSPVNGKITGLEGSKSGLWREYKRLVGEILPKFVFIENSANLRSKGLDTILKDLDKLGYDAAWGVLGAGDCKAPHQRKRMWIMATNTYRTQCKGRWLSGRRFKELADAWLGTRWETEPDVHRVDDGLAHRMVRLKAIGNGQVPDVASKAAITLASIIDTSYEEEDEEENT